MIKPVVAPVVIIHYRLPVRDVRVAVIKEFVNIRSYVVLLRAPDLPAQYILAHAVVLKNGLFV